MGESQSKQKSNTKVAQCGVLQDVDAIFETKDQMEKDLLKHRDQQSFLSKYTKNPNPSLCDPFITTEPS